MKKLILLILFLTPAARAESNLAGWKFGAGFGIQSSVRSTTHFEVGTPSHTDSYGGMHSAILAVDLLDTTYRDSDNHNYGYTSAKLMYELRNSVQKDLLSTYIRVGVGYSWINKILESKGYMVTLPIYLGVDFLVRETPRSVSSFFIQTGYNFNFVNDSQPASSFNGTQIMVGFRAFF